MIATLVTLVSTSPSAAQLLAGFAAVLFALALVVIWWSHKNPPVRIAAEVLIVAAFVLLALAVMWGLPGGVAS